MCMKKWFRLGFLTIFFGVTLACFGMKVQAKGDENRIKKGIYADTVDLSGLTQEEALAAIENYVDNIKNVEITLVAAKNTEVVVTARELGIAFSNPQLVTEALQLGRKGNIIQRYKELKDLEHHNKVFKVELVCDVHAIDSILLERCVPFDQKAVNTSLKRKEGAFVLMEGQTGYLLDVETSIDRIRDFLLEQWDYSPCRIELEVAVDEPKGTAEELSKVQDILGTFTTSFTSSGASRSANVQNGCRLIDGITLYPGEEFSTYDTVSPFTEGNGYHMAGSYINGKVVDSLGGGICQVSTTLYNAVLLSELNVTERHNHSMIVSYVDPSADAAIAESAGKDFRFTNNTDYPIYIEGYTKNKKITFNIYGCETRQANRQVSFESEVLEVKEPPADVIYADAGQPLGAIQVESAHIGYKAQLWKIVKENGVQVSREKVNASTYKMSPRSATVGTATPDSHAYEEIMAAIGTNNIDHVKNVIAALTASE